MVNFAVMLSADHIPSVLCGF